MNDHHYAHTVSVAGQQIKSVIDAYAMGPIRALAQEPVQNAIDAARSRNTKVRIEYRLLLRQTSAGAPCNILTVTDSGTTGLQGEVLKPEELEKRGFELEDDDNWTAFEGNGFTKGRDDALGSRGQGKSAFFYHSEVPGPRRRMLMLYDTLLPNAEYRLGVRFVQPVDRVRIPPLYGKSARDAIKQKWFETNEGVSVPLGLDPLQEVGTRVIVPFLGTEASEALCNSELEGWLQRCWWRAIQIGRLEITVVNEVAGWDRTIDVPEWWEGIPNKDTNQSRVLHHHSGSSFMMWENEQLQKRELVVKRLVLLHGDDLEEEEIGGDEPEYAGIQMMRGQQWIETRGQKELFVNEVSDDVRKGFRGFVEFDRVTEPTLKRIEKPQHDRFDGRKGGYKTVINAWLRERVRDFSNEMGWVDRPDEQEERASQHEKQTMERIANTFLVPMKKPDSDGRTVDEQLDWSCKLLLTYPRADSLRVEHGEMLRNLAVELHCEPEAPPATNFNMSVTLTREMTGERHELLHKENELMRPSYKCMLGDWQVVKGRAKREKKQLSCPWPETFILGAEVHSDGACVAKTQRKLFVAHDPPVPQKKPHLLTISLENLSNPGQQRVNSGDHLRVQFTVTNHSVEAFEGVVEARLGDVLLADDLAVQLSGTPLGDTPSPVVAWNGVWDGKLILMLDGEAPPTVPNMARTIKLVPGKIPIQADLFDKEKKAPLDSRRKYILFQNDQGNAQNDLPFTLMTTHGGFFPPMWKLDLSGASLTLYYPADYPLCFALKDAALAKKSTFTEEIIFHGLLEWALRPIQEEDDVTNIDSLLEASLDGADERLRRSYLDTLETLRDFDPENGMMFEFNLMWREAVAQMLAIFRER